MGNRQSIHTTSSGGKSNGLSGIDTVGPMRKGTGPRRPIPDEGELERRFNEVLIQMDLPPERAKHLKSFDNQKKWEIVCDQEQVHARDPPSTYLLKIRTYLDPNASKSSKKIRSLGDNTSTQVLRNLEISLRTNNIEWVREFLNLENNGLDVLVDYLSGRLIVLRHTMKIEDGSLDESHHGNMSLKSHSGSLKSTSSLKKVANASLDFEGPRISKLMRHSTKLKMGDTPDDIHVCIMCLRAIMNNKFGFNMVIQHKQAINCIAMSLIHRKLRTKALVLELLAAICLAVKGGHDIILSAFDYFKVETGEVKRFETLMRYFVCPDSFQIEFMVACMQFINIVVHSVEDMNFRVALQWEFSSLGLDECLDKLRHHESEELSVQISAYIDNEFDVAALMEEAESKAAALERVNELEDEVGRVNELLHELEVDAMSKQVEMENQIDELRRERDQLLERSQQVESEYSTLRKTMSSKEEDSKRRQSMLEEKIKNLEAERSRLVSSASVSTSNSSLASSEVNPTIVTPVPAPAPPPPPPPPLAAAPPPPPPPGPPPPPFGAPGPPPPPPPMGGKTDPNLTIRRAIQTTYKLPTVHWVALKPNDTKDTIWYLMDDVKLMKDIDFSSFEEEFKLNPTPINSNKTGGFGGLNGSPTSSEPKKAPAKQFDSLMEHTRLKNMAICKRKLPNIPTSELIKCVNALDIKTLNMETVELLQRMVPLEVEVKAYRDYNTANKDIDKLTEEDKLMRQFSCVERFGTKLQIMSFMSTFDDNVKNIRPQITSISLASKSLRNSKKMKKVLELILAFGNYMNSTKKGPCYGFKLQSLDSLTITKSKDKKQHLVHYLVDYVQKKYPDLANFYTESTCVDKAAQFSLENLMTDMRELEKGMEITKRELEHRLSTPNAKDRAKLAQNQALKDFVDAASDQLKTLRQETNRAESLFRDCVEYYGENSKMMEANTFFGYFVRFISLWKQSEIENEKRRKMQQKLAAEAEAAAKQQMEQVSRINQANQRRNLQNDLIREFKSKSRSHIKPDEVNDGTLEDIIFGLKSKPYRANDNEAMRKSFRRHRNNDKFTSLMTSQSGAL